MDPILPLSKGSLLSIKVLYMDLLPDIKAYLHPKLNDGSIFKFWTNDWLEQETLMSSFPKLYYRSSTRDISIANMWHDVIGNFSPISLIIWHLVIMMN